MNVNQLKVDWPAIFISQTSWFTTNVIKYKLLIQRPLLHKFLIKQLKCQQFKVYAFFIVNVHQYYIFSYIFLQKIFLIGRLLRGGKNLILLYSVLNLVSKFLNALSHSNKTVLLAFQNNQIYLEACIFATNRLFIFEP